MHYIIFNTGSLYESGIKYSEVSLNLISIHGGVVYKRKKFYVRLGRNTRMLIQDKQIYYY